jgi:hypothetical protein
VRSEAFIGELTEYPLKIRLTGHVISERCGMTDELKAVAQASVMLAVGVTKLFIEQPCSVVTSVAITFHLVLESVEDGLVDKVITRDLGEEEFILQILEVRTGLIAVIVDGIIIAIRTVSVMVYNVIGERVVASFTYPSVVLGTVFTPHFGIAVIIDKDFCEIAATPPIIADVISTVFAAAKIPFHAVFTVELIVNEKCLVLTNNLTAVITVNEFVMETVVAVELSFNLVHVRGILDDAAAALADVSGVLVDVSIHGMYLPFNLVSRFGSVGGLVLHQETMRLLDLSGLLRCL